MSTMAVDEQLPLHMVKALSYEIDAAANLLQQSLILVHGFRVASLDADPLFACLAIGMEKVTKLTVGLAAVEEEGRWPSLQTMRAHYGHDVVALDRRCRDYIASHADRAPAAPYVRRLLAGVEEDERIALILGAMKRYGTTGRFYNLDALADMPQADPPPRELWEEVERSVWEDDPALLTELGGPGFDEARRSINSRIAESIEGWWELYFRAWIQGVVGPHARQWSAQLSPRTSS